MPSSAVHIFTDPGDYAATIRASTHEMTVTGRGRFAAKLTRIDLHRLWMVLRESPAGFALGHRDRARHHFVPHTAWAKPPLERCGIAAD
jgi:hypothetical protein